MSRHRFFSLNILRIFRLRGLWGVYLNAAFRDLGIALISIFIPIYIYRLTGSLSQTFLFYALYNFTVLPAGWLAGRLAQKMGLDILEFLSAVTRTFFLLALMLAGRWPGLIWPAAVLWGVTIPFCWIPYHYTVLEKCDHSQLGRTISKLDIISKFMVGIGPFLGGLLIISFGFSILYFFAILSFLVSGAVIFLDDFDRKKMRLNFGKIIKRFYRPSLRQFWLGMVGYSFESQVASVVWPLYIFMVVSSYAVLGGIQSVSFLGSIFTLWAVGKWVDEKGSGILNYGIVGNVLNWIIRPFLLSGALIFLSALSYKILSIFIWVPFMAITYKKASQMHRLEFLIQRDWLIHFSSGVASLIMLFFVSVFHLSWSALFSLAIGGLLLCTLIVTPGVKNKS